MVKKLFLVLVSVVVLIGVWIAVQRYLIPYLNKPKAVVPVTANNSWWKYGGNAQNSFTSIGKGLKGKRAWTYQSPARIFESPVIGSDGTVYVNDSKYVYALYPDTGKIKWQYGNGKDLAIHEHPGIVPIIAASDGKLYVAADKSIILLYQKTGKMKKEVPINSQQVQAAVMGTDGTIYVVCDMRKIIAVK